MSKFDTALNLELIRLRDLTEGINKASEITAVSELLFPKAVAVTAAAPTTTASETQINPKEDLKAKRRALCLFLLEIDQATFEKIKDAKYNEKTLPELVGNATWKNILDRRKKFFQSTETVSVDRLKTDAGTLHQFSIKLDNNTTQTINFHRKFSYGAERILTADPVSMQADQWRMMQDRGHGLYANSLVSRIIGTLGQYISAVERKYNLTPALIDGVYQLSDKSMAELKKKDINAFRKYVEFRTVQEHLRKSFLPLERAVDPTDNKAAIHFKNTLHIVLACLRSETNQASKGEKDTMQITSDHVAAAAHNNLPVI